MTPRNSNSPRTGSWRVPKARVRKTPDSLPAKIPIGTAVGVPAMVATVGDAAQGLWGVYTMCRKGTFSAHVLRKQTIVSWGRRVTGELSGTPHGELSGTPHGFAKKAEAAREIDAWGS